jgi:hypothetical protein
VLYSALYSYAIALMQWAIVLKTPFGHLASCLLQKIDPPHFNPEERIRGGYKFCIKFIPVV